MVRSVALLFIYIAFTFQLDYSQGFPVAKNPSCHSTQLFTNGKSLPSIPSQNRKDPHNKLSVSRRIPAAGAATSAVAEYSDSKRGLDAVLKGINAFVQRNFLVVGMAVGVSFARALPSLGATGTIAEAIISKYGVFLVFLLSGLSIELKELKDAAFQLRLNVLIQGLNLIAWPFLIGLPTVKALRMFLPGILPNSVLDGILILTCLPTTVNMCVFLTGAANGNVASSLCNSVIGNFLGMFVTPALLLHFFGTSIAFPFGAMVTKLCSKVLLPVAIGQVLRTTRAKHVYTNNSKLFKIAQDLSLIGIAWTAFCNAFSKGVGGLGPRSVISLFGILLVLHLASVWSLFTIFKAKVLGFSREDIVAGTFTASHKTMAFGLPLVKTVFDGNPNLAFYCAPVMLIHPLQLFLGSFMVPFFRSYTAQGDVAKPNEQ